MGPAEASRLVITSMGIPMFQTGLTATPAPKRNVNARKSNFHFKSHRNIVIHPIHLDTSPQP